VGDGNELDFVRADFNAGGRNHFTERCGIEKGGFFEPLFDKSEREARAEDGDI